MGRLVEGVAVGLGQIGLHEAGREVAFRLLRGFRFVAAAVFEETAHWDFVGDEPHNAFVLFLLFLLLPRCRRCLGERWTPPRLSLPESASLGSLFPLGPAAGYPFQFRWLGISSTAAASCRSFLLLSLFDH